MAEVAFDTSTLLLVLEPAASPPIDPATSLPLVHAAERVDYLVKRLSLARDTVLIPTPVLAEVLSKAGPAGPRYVQLLQKAPFKIAPFDTRAAIECAEGLAHHFSHKASAKGPGKGTPGARAKVKFDQQVVAIAKANGAATLYSDDQDVYRDARRVGITVIRSYELPRDPDLAQSPLFPADAPVKAAPRATKGRKGRQQGGEGGE